METNENGLTELQTGTSSSGFKMTGAGMFISAVFLVLAAFNIVSLTNEQKEAVFYIFGTGLVFLPALYHTVRASLVKRVSDNNTEIVSMGTIDK